MISYSTFAIYVFVILLVVIAIIYSESDKYKNKIHTLEKEVAKWKFQSWLNALPISQNEIKIWSPSVIVAENQIFAEYMVTVYDDPQIETILKSNVWSLPKGITVRISLAERNNLKED